MAKTVLDSSWFYPPSLWEGLGTGLPFIRLVHPVDKAFLKRIEKFGTPGFADTDFEKSPVVLPKINIKNLFRECRDFFQFSPAVIKHTFGLQSIHQFNERNF